MSGTELVILALLFGLGIAATSGDEEPEFDETAPEPSFFQLPDFTVIQPQYFPEQPIFPVQPVAPIAPQPAIEEPYWLVETRRRFPGLNVLVGPSE